MSGKYKKSTGEVLMVDHRRNMLKVKGANLRKARVQQYSRFSLAEVLWQQGLGV